MSFTVNIGGLDQLAPELLEDAQLGIHDGFELVGIEGARIVQGNIASPYNGKPAAVSTGHLADSVISTVTDDPAMQRLIIGVSNSLGADAYAAPVETGARPHLPPIEPLVSWVMRKFNAKDEKAATSLAWAIARSMAAKGTQGHEMFSRGLDELEPLAGPIIERAMAARLMARAGVA